MTQRIDARLQAQQIDALAKQLDNAMLAGQERARLTQEVPGLNNADAYRIQRAGVALRLARGERVVGYKMGLTSAAKRAQMNLDSPIYGVLTDAMQVDDGGAWQTTGSIHPKIEPEVAFLIARDLRGPVTAQEALAACSEVRAALEILDSRYVGFKYFSLPDVIADNASSAFFVLAETGVAPEALDILDLPMRMFVDDHLAQEARSSAISGNPVLSLVQLCDMLAEHGDWLPAGSIVLAGAAATAEPLVAGRTVRLEIDGLPGVQVTAV